MKRSKLHYLDHYPFLGAESKQLLDFEDERVLIVTDVMATGVVSKDLACFIEDMGGETVAILCAVLTDETMIQQQNGGPPVLEYGRKPTKVLVHSLTDYEIPAADATGRIIKIDAATALPEHSAAHGSRFTPLFEPQEMFNHFESSEAISFDFYQQGNRRFTTGIRVRKLLAGQGDAIWQKIQHCFEKNSTIVTTFDRADMWFKNFVEDRLRANNVEPKTVFIPRPESIEVPDCYSLVDNNEFWLKKSPVVLLLSSVHTSENLRNLVSLLASASVSSITVICLFNRMGPQTENFVSRIEAILRGGKGEDRRGAEGTKSYPAKFVFLPVYAVCELSHKNIAKMQATVQTLLDHYVSETRVRSFQRQVNQVRRQFESQTVTSRAFKVAKSGILREKFSYHVTRDGPEISVGTRAGKLSLFSAHLVATRDYAPLIRELEKSDDPYTLYKLFGMFLADLSFLQMTGRLEDVRNALMAARQSVA